jgi:chromosome segregation ATPase
LSLKESEYQSSPLEESDDPKFQKLWKKRYLNEIEVTRSVKEQLKDAQKANELLELQLNQIRSENLESKFKALQVERDYYQSAFDKLETQYNVLLTQLNSSNEEITNLKRSIK